jgi:hypothetical protein
MTPVASQAVQTADQEDNDGISKIELVQDKLRLVNLQSLFRVLTIPMVNLLNPKDLEALRGVDFLAPPTVVLIALMSLLLRRFCFSTIFKLFHLSRF